MEQHPKLSIIFLNYRSSLLLSCCLNSFYLINRNFSFEIIVVNNDKESLTDFSSKYPNNKILEINNNIGFAAGNNVGAREANGEILAFINPDILFSKNFDFSDLLKQFENKQVGIVGPGLLDKSGRSQNWQAGCEISLLDTLKNNFGKKNSKKYWISNEKVTVDWVSGAFLVIRKKLFDELNGFDENFFMYFEDVDLCLRARRRNYKVVFYPEQKVVHLGGQSKESDKIQKEYFYQSQEYYFKKNRPAFERVFLEMFRKIFNK